MKLQSRAEGYADDRAVWEALGKNPNLAVIDAFAIGGGGFGGGGDFALDGVEDKDTTFKPITGTGPRRHQPRQRAGCPGDRRHHDEGERALPGPVVVRRRRSTRSSRVRDRPSTS